MRDCGNPECKDCHPVGGAASTRPAAAPIRLSDPGVKLPDWLRQTIARARRPQPLRKAAAGHRR